MPKYLIIRFSSIGDIVLTTPVIRCLKLQKNAEIHYLTKNQYRSILEPNPYIDKLFSIKKKVSKVLSQLKQEKYDAVIDLHHNLRSAQVKLALGHRSYSFDKINFQKWLMVNFKVNVLPDIHIVDRYLSTTAPLGIQNDNAGLDYFLPLPDVEMKENILAKIGRYHLDMPFIAFAIGAAHATKKLPFEKIEAICRSLRLPIILLGGPQEAEEGEKLSQMANHITNTCGKISVSESAFIIKKSSLVISHDTGMMHIAAAFRKKIISVWGNTIPEFGMYPYYPEGMKLNYTQEVKGLPCRPCSKIGYGKCPKGHFKCMWEISVENIVKIINAETAG